MSDPKKQPKYVERGPAEHPDDDRMHISQEGSERRDPRVETKRENIERNGDADLDRGRRDR